MIKNISAVLAIMVAFQPVMISFACDPVDPPPDCSDCESALAAARALLEQACAAMDAAKAALDAATADYQAAKQKEEEEAADYEHAKQVMEAKKAQYDQTKAALKTAQIANDDATWAAELADLAFSVALAKKDAVAIITTGLVLANALRVLWRTSGALAAAMVANNTADVALRAATRLAQVAYDRWKTAQAETATKEQIMIEKQNAYDQAFKAMEDASKAVDNALNALENCLHPNG